jgi:hypothetical protein
VSGLREALKGKKEAALAYVRAHPDESKAEQARGAGVSETLIAQVRQELIASEERAASRKARAEAAKPTPAPETPATLDHAAMLAIANLADLAADKLDDEEVQKRLQRQALTFAFDPKLHPDTRMSASQQWIKLRDGAREKNLGPGNPKTFADGVRRLADLHIACGPDMVLAAVALAFDVKEAPDAKANVQALGPGVASPAPGPA